MAKKISKHGIALYGGIAVERGYCKDCKNYAFIRDGKYSCCDTLVKQEIPDKYYRQSEGTPKRRKPSRAEQERILTEQEHSCFYCGVLFGSIVRRNDKEVTIAVNWDHRLPYSLWLNNRPENFVAACHVCNQIKSDKIFENVQEAQGYIAAKRKKKGYNF